MKEKFLLLLAVAVLLLCVACAPEAEVVAAPESLETPVPTEVPAPTEMPTQWPVFTPSPSWTPDTLWVELMDSVGICLLGSHTFKTTLPTGPRVTQITLYFSAGDAVYVFPVEESVWLPYEGFREFMGVSNEVEIDQFDRVLVSIKIDGQVVQLSLPLEDCPPPAWITPL